MPDTVTVEPLTPVTLPDAMARFGQGLAEVGCSTAAGTTAEARTRPALGASRATGAAASAEAESAWSSGAGARGGAASTECACTTPTSWLCSP